MKPSSDEIIKWSNIHIVLWLIKDFFWIADYKFAGTIMILPTFGVAIFNTIYFRHLKSELFHNLAVCCWIMANSIWMIGEFYFHDSTRLYAKILFILGILLLMVYYTLLRPQSENRTSNNHS